MHSDCTFVTGKTHAICQDYAEAFDTADGYSTVLLSDGCSSSPNTDFGARLLVRSGRNEIGRYKLLSDRNNNNARERFVEATVYGAIAGVRFLGLPEESLDATLLTIRANENQYVADMHGDGVIAAGYEDGSILVTHVEYLKSYPRYLSYSINPSRFASWEDIVSKDLADDEGPRIVRHHWLRAPKQGNERMDEADETDEYFPNFDYIVSEVDLWNNTQIQPNNTKWVAVMSDGVGSFTETITQGASKKQVPVPLLTVLDVLLDFTNFNGVFVQRQLKWFLKEAEKRNWQHADDVSIGVVCV